MTSVVPSLQRVGQRLGRDGCRRSAEHGLEAALHVEAVVAVADRLVERGQLVGVARSCSATASIKLALRVCVDRMRVLHAARRSARPSASK